MIKVKISTPFPNWPIIRQTPGMKGVWDNCKFYINHNIEKCDYWIVYEDLLRVENVICPKENIVFITGEPPTIRTYDEEFLSQFSALITCNRLLKHGNALYEQQALPWHVGIQRSGKSINFCQDYDGLKSTTIFKKNKLISAIVSQKKSTEGHKKRLEFIKNLKLYFGERLDIYGHGSNFIDNKWDAIADYKYHIVIENSFFDDYWTEKLSDSFLGGAYPFYFGCPNIEKYFNKNSLCKIDINNIRHSIEKIDEKIQKQVYEESVNHILKAREMVLDSYNLFPTVCSYINNNLNLTGYINNTLQPHKYYTKKRTLFYKIKEIMKKRDLKK